MTARCLYDVIPSAHAALCTRHVTPRRSAGHCRLQIPPFWGTAAQGLSDGPMVPASIRGRRASRLDGGDAMKRHRLLWVQESTTSIAWLDAEHRDLVDRYQAVVDALREDDDAFVDRLIDLREWLSRHFHNEEAALQQIGCAESYQHREDHQKFVRTLEDFTSNSRKIYDHRDRSAVSKYIFYWLIRHGNTYDARISSPSRHASDRVELHRG